MRVIFWGKGSRGVACLEALSDAGYHPVLCVCHPRREDGSLDALTSAARNREIPVIAPEDPNESLVEGRLAEAGADLFVLAGYGKILGPNILELPRIMSINLHGGRLPQYRGSSPMNWALIRGESSFGISIIRLDEGVDTGDLLAERTFEIGPDDTIRDLHVTANEAFAEMLLEVVGAIHDGTCRPRPQDPEQASYFPRRFPDDGLILWDQLTAREVHNRIRALTEPYPCAFTLFRGRKVKLISSMMHESPFFGEAGRIYAQSERGLLVASSDRCLWIVEAVFEDDGSPLVESVERYDRLATVSHLAYEAVRLHREESVS